MQRPLDPLNFKQNIYERPTQQWVCGRAAEGHPCPLGPDGGGKCPGMGECQPVLKGDRWICTRLEAFGGQCEEGPGPTGECVHRRPPCQPIRSLRQLRRITVSLVLAFTLGALFYLLSGKWRDRWLEPGDLSAVHGASGNRVTAAVNCGDCHSAPQITMGETPAVFFAHRDLADSKLCLKCHTLGDNPLQAHGVAAPTLAELTRKAQSSASRTKAPLVLQISHAVSGLDPEGGQLACAICHHEHHGRDANITQFADAQCQTCHAAQFASFAHGHPEFGEYPYERRTRIFFDHTSHFEKHFTEEKKDVAPNSCQDCHTVEASGRMMLVKDFEQTCAACHSGEIKGEGMEKKGIAFFSIPDLDVDTLESKGYRIGEWPKGGDELTPFMKLLLGSNAGLRAAMEKLRGIELGDLTKASADKLGAAEKVAWGVKSLLFDLTTGGHDMLLKRLRMDIPDEQTQMTPELTGRMSRATVVAAQKEWMPHLLSEVPDYRKGIKPPPRPAPAPKALPPPAVKPAPPGGDDILDASPAPVAPKGPKSGGDDSILDDAEPHAAPSPPATPEQHSNPLDATQPKTPIKPPADFWVNPMYAKPKKEPVKENTPPAEIKPSEDWMADGGWYRPENSFTLFYRPVGHADPFLKAWLTTLASLSAGVSADVARSAFDKLADPDAPGACMKCHTVDAGDHQARVNWFPARPEPHAHPLTVFNHTAHFSLLTDRGCATCHQLAPEAEYAKFFMPTDGALPKNPNKFASNFAPLSETVCAQCHKPQVAGDNCLLCHRYHTGDFAPKVQEAAAFRLSPPPTNAVHEQ